MTAGVAVTRPEAAWRDRLRRVRVIRNGETLGTVAGGETETFEVPTGTARFEVALDWTHSRPLELTVREGETATLVVLPGPTYRMLFRTGYLVLELG